MSQLNVQFIGSPAWPVGKSTGVRDTTICLVKKGLGKATSLLSDGQECSLSINLSDANILITFSQNGLRPR